MASTKTAAKPKPVVKDAKGNALELRMKFVLPAEDKLTGTITGIEHQRGRVVILPDGSDTKIVRPAAKGHVLKNRSGKVQRVERAARAGSKAAATANA